MKTRKKQPAGSGSFQLPSTLRIADVNAVKEAWRKQFGPDMRGHVVCVGSAVQAVDGAGVQLLLGCKQATLVAGREFTLTDPSPTLLDALRCSGASAAFGF
jgi:anti-anti-sigma regulatory factor